MKRPAAKKFGKMIASPKKVRKASKNLKKVETRSKLITGYMVPKKPQKRSDSSMSSKIAEKFSKEIDTAWVKYLHMVTFQKSLKRPPTSTWAKYWVDHMIKRGWELRERGSLGLPNYKLWNPPSRKRKGQ